MELGERDKRLWEVAKSLCKKKSGNTESFYRNVLNNFVRLKCYGIKDLPYLKEVIRTEELSTAMAKLISIKDEIELAVDRLLDGEKLEGVLEDVVESSPAVLYHYWHRVLYPDPFASSEETTAIGNIPMVAAPLGTTFNCPNCGAQLVGKGDEDSDNTPCPMCKTTMKLGPLQ